LRKDEKEKYNGQKKNEKKKRGDDAPWGIPPGTRKGAGSNGKVRGTPSERDSLDSRSLEREEGETQ